MGAGSAGRAAPKLDANRLEPSPSVEPEHRAEDDLERDRLHPRPEPERVTTRPAIDLARAISPSARGSSASARRETGATAACAVHVRGCRRAAAANARPAPGAGSGCASPAWKTSRISREHLLDVLGVGKHHPRALVDDPQRERLAEALSHCGQHPLRTAEPDRGLQSQRHPRAAEGGRGWGSWLDLEVRLVGHRPADEDPIAVLGAGSTMGLPMARNLARAGFGVRAWNRTRQRRRNSSRGDGVRLLDSPAQAAGWRRGAPDDAVRRGRGDRRRRGRRWRRVSDGAVWLADEHDRRDRGRALLGARRRARGSRCSTLRCSAPNSPPSRPSW